MKLFDLALQLNGYPLKKAEAFLKETQEVHGSGIKAYQEKKRNDIVNYHLNHNHYYQTLLKNKQFKNWDDIPILTKRHLQRPLHERLSKSFQPNTVYKNKTSGSTGDPFSFAKDKFCHALTWAVIKNRFGWHDIDLNTSLQARFYGIPKEFIANLKEKTKDYLSKRKRFSVFDISEDSFETALKTFQTTNFEYINGYTTAIVQFAKFLEKRGIILKDMCPSLKVCVITSEMLFEEDRKLMEHYFGVAVVNEYGASELDLIAFEDPQGIWRLNWETLFIEVVDENGKPLEDGQHGKILITSLYNKAHPFIRYEIGDVGTLTPNLNPPSLKNLIGRSNDLVRLPSGKTAAGLTLYYVTKSLIEDDANVKEFVIEQQSLHDFTIIYVSEHELSKSQFYTIKAAMERYLEPGLNYYFERRDNIDRSESGKLKQFKNLIHRA